MKKALLYLMVLALAAMAVPTNAENLLVREDRIWNYELQSTLGTTTVTAENGYHFKGKKTIDGVEYSIFRDGKGNEEGYLREEDGKVYRYLYDRTPAYFTQPGEYLLYDFNAKAGDKFSCVGFDENTGWFCEMLDAEVAEISDITYHAMSYECQHLHIARQLPDEKYEEAKVVVGAGALRGLLSSPQYIGILSGMYWKYYYLRSMTTLDGEVLFRSDFGMLPEFDKRFNPNDKLEYFTVEQARESASGTCQLLPFTLQSAGTEERDGNTYWRLEWNTKDKEFDNPPYFLFREDHGTCYTYIEYPADTEVGAGDVQPGEYLVYDFNMEEGESFDAPALLIGAVFEGYSPRSTSLFHFEIKKKYTDDSGRRVLELSCKSLDEKYIGEETVKVVEGVGFIQNGTVASLVLPFQTTGFKAGPYVMFNQMLDKDGETVFLNPNELEAGFFKERDYTWIYGIYDSKGNVSYAKCGFNYLAAITPEGEDTKSVYRRFGTFATSDSMEGEWKDANFNCSLVREDAGKVWLYHSEGLTNYDPYKTPLQESLIYDFNATYASELTLYTPDGEQEFYVIPTTSVVGGKNVKSYIFREGNYVKCVEGIGIVKGGILPCVNGEFRLPLTDDDTSYCGAALLAVYDGDGNLLFSQDMPSGIGEIATDADGWTAPADRLYDLQGRELREPQPGQPYIKGGKIYVGISEE